MKLYLKKEERDYSMSGGLFNSSQFQDVIILDEKKKHIATLLIQQTYSHSNQWGTHEITGYVDVKHATKELTKYMEDKYGGFNLETVNKLFTPMEYTKGEELEEVTI